MFTGIIQAMGQAILIQDHNGGKVIVFTAPKEILIELKIGDSISVSGACSTAIEITETTFKVDYLPESLAKTTINELTVGSTINLELCLTPQSRIGGHFVTGHVDTVGQISKLSQDNPWGIIEVTFDQQWGKNVVDKGSITIDGISLTVVDRTPISLSCHLIPHTFANTILGQKKVGDKVNLEFDVLGKYVLNGAR